MPPKPSAKTPVKKAAVKSEPVTPVAPVPPSRYVGNKYKRV